MFSFQQIACRLVRVSLVVGIGWLLGIWASPVVAADAATPLQVVISEVAWAGTVADVSGEWIELYNNSAGTIDLTGWTLTAADGAPSITLSGRIAPGGYFLLERTDDTTVANVSADQIYSGALGNTGEVLTLRDASTNVIDTANLGGTAWPAGDSTTRASMSRITLSAADSPANWQNGVAGTALDALGNPILGSPQHSLLPTLTPTPTPLATNTPTPSPVTPTSTVIPNSGWILNEINADPDTALGDANKDGVISSDDDEFIEFVNQTGALVDISGWMLLDGTGVRFTFPDGINLPNGCAVVVFGGGTPTGTFGDAVVFTTTSLGLGNTADTVMLQNSASAPVAAYTYGAEGGNNQSITRNPDLTGAYVEHTVANASLLYSPGTKVDGTSVFGTNCKASITPYATVTATATKTATPTITRTPTTTATATKTATPNATITATATKVPLKIYLPIVLRAQ